MGGAKDEEVRLRRPLFTRLHLNGSNKRISRLSMSKNVALYKQISLPAQRFSSGSLPLYPLPSPSIASTHVENPEKSMVWQHCDSHDSLTWVAPKHHPFNSFNVIDSEGYQQSNNNQKCGDYEIDSERGRSRASLPLQIVCGMEAEESELLNLTRHSVKSKFHDFEEEENKLVHVIFGLEKTDVHRLQACQNQVHEKSSFHGKLVETRETNCACRVKSEGRHRLSLGLDSEGEMNSAPCQAKVVSPTDVIGVMGEKQFWDVRRSILKYWDANAIVICFPTVSQQKLFALQVFELHRLVKVQKLIAESRNILFEGGHPSGELPVEVPNMLLSDQRPVINGTTKNVHSQKPNKSLVEGTDEHVVLKLSLPCLNNGTTADQHLKLAPSLTTASRPLMNIDSSSWCFPPTGSQWLVPIMSSSEGPMYKPYAAASGVPAVPHQHGFGIPLGSSPSTYMPVYGISVQGRATSTSPFERARGQALPLFPMEPMHAQNSEAAQVQRQVMKVVTCDSKSTSASAAKIFESIQKERKLDDD